MRLSIFACLSLIVLFPAQTWAQRTPLYQVSSRYGVDGGKATVRVQGTGTPVQFERTNPETHKKETVCAVFTESHVTGGAASSLKVHLEGDKPVGVGDRCIDADHDLELMILKSCKGFKALATYNPKTGYFDVDAATLDNWYLERSSGLSSEVIVFPDVVYWMSRLVNFVSKSGRAISVGHRGGNARFHAAIPQALVPGWVEYDPKPAINEGGDPRRYSSARIPEQTEDFLPLTAYGQEVASLGAISPGMSGAPVIADVATERSIMLFLRRLANWDWNLTRKGVLLGISSRVMRNSSRSYFSSPETMRQLVERSLKGSCDRVPETTWRYRVSAGGEGLTYRVYKTKWGDITEIAPTAARAGSASSLDLGTGGSGDVGTGGSGDVGTGGSGDVGTGGSGDVGTGGSGDVGTGGSGDVGSGDKREIVIGYNESDKGSGEKDRLNSYLRLGVKPGLRIVAPSGKARDVLAIRATGGSPSVSQAIFADAAAIDFLKKNASDYDFQFVDDASFFRSYFSEIKECSREERGRLQILRSPSGLQFTIRSSYGDTLNFALDELGRLIGEPAPYFVPEIKVRGEPSGRVYDVDLTEFFFTDLSRTYIGPVHPEVKGLVPRRSPVDAVAGGNPLWISISYPGADGSERLMSYGRGNVTDPSVCSKQSSAEGCAKEPESSPVTGDLAGVQKALQSALETPDELAELGTRRGTAYEYPKIKLPDGRLASVGQTAMRGDGKAFCAYYGKKLLKVDAAGCDLNDLCDGPAVLLDASGKILKVQPDSKTYGVLLKVTCTD